MMSFAKNANAFYFVISFLFFVSFLGYRFFDGEIKLYIKRYINNTVDRLFPLILYLCSCKTTTTTTTITIIIIIFNFIRRRSIQQQKRIHKKRGTEKSITKKQK